MSEGVVWANSVMLVWGGISSTGASAEQAADGAAYDPATDSWQPIPSAPGGLKGGGGQAAVWTGSRAIFWVGNSPDGPVGGAVYDPARSTWRLLPKGPLGIREGYVSVFDGDRMLIVGGVGGDQIASPTAASVDPAGSWQLPTALNRVKGLLPTSALWAGFAAVYGNLSLCPEKGSGCQKYRPIFLAYEPSKDAVHEFPLSRVPVGPNQLRSLVLTALTGHSFLFTTGGDPAAAPVLFDLDSNLWHVGSRAPCEPADSTYSQTAWAGSVLVVPCGKDQLALYDPAADSWKTITAGASPLNSRSGSAIAWTGTKLIVWSGTTRRSGNSTLKSGAIIDLSAYTHS
jgi:hypothetical protein